MEAASNDKLPNTVVDPLYVMTVAHGMPDRVMAHGGSLHRFFLKVPYDLQDQSVKIPQAQFFQIQELVWSIPGSFHQDQRKGIRWWTVRMLRVTGKREEENMKIFLGALLSAVLMATTPMLSQAGIGGHGMNDGMLQQAFDEYEHQFQMNFVSEEDHSLQHELDHVVGTMLQAFGGQFVIHHPDSDQEVLVTIPDDAPSRWFQMEWMQDEDMAEFDPETNILTVHHLRMGGQAQRNIHLRIKLHEDGTWEIMK